MIRKAMIFALVGLCASGVNASAMTDTQIKQAIIQESIANYPGNCPCPYNTARNGSRCGRRSAYTRPGGYSPICYEGDINPQMVREYRVQQRLGP